MDPMLTQPYLETCCRSALHRLMLAASAGRPAETKDSGCLARLERMGLAIRQPDGRCVISEAGIRRHATIIASSR